MTKSDKMYFGIDLGTTNSCISVYRNGVSTAIPLDDSGTTTIPSCVMWEGGETFSVGSNAYAHRGDSSVAYSTKRMMGSGNTITLEYKGERREFTPAEIASKILIALVHKAKRLYKNINDVVVCVPAYFNNNQISETKSAIDMTGLNCLQVAKEPTAAALVYNSIGGVHKEKILVYDLGGGTFDVSLVAIEPPSSNSLLDVYGLTSINKTLFHVLGVDGNPKLGGDDIDDNLVKICLTQLPKGVILPKETLEKLKLFCEQVKKSVSLEATYPLILDGVQYSVSLTIKDVEAATVRVYNKAKKSVKRLLSFGQNNKGISQLITVGGSTLSPIIRNKLKKDFPGITLNFSLNPDESVSLGAAIHAAAIGSEISGLTIVDCLSMNYGFSMANGAFTPVLKEGSAIPVSEYYVASTVDSNQTKLNIHFYQGISPFASECTYIGSIEVDGITSGLVKIEMTVDSDGLLGVYVCDRTGVSRKESLVNILGVNVPNTAISDNKKSGRWKALAIKLNNQELSELVDLYVETGDVELENTIINIIRGVSDLTSLSQDAVLFHKAQEVENI